MTALDALEAAEKAATPGGKFDVDWNAPTTVLNSDGSGKHIASFSSPRDAALFALLRNHAADLIAVARAAEHARLVENYVLSEYRPEGTDLERALAPLLTERES